MQIRTDLQGYFRFTFGEGVQSNADFSASNSDDNLMSSVTRGVNFPGGIGGLSASGGSLTDCELQVSVAGYRPLTKTITPDASDLEMIDVGTLRLSRLAGVQPPAEASASPAPKRAKVDLWYPPDIDRVIPQVLPGTTCPLSDLLSKAGKRIEELVQNVDKFTATESVQHQDVVGSDKLGVREIRKFNYLVSITRAANGNMNVEEYRDGGLGQFPDHVATLGTPALALIFHPHEVTNFTMTCEGLGQWHAQPAWQVRFEERRSNNSISTIIIGGHVFNLRLRGRAWILADSYQVGRLETDLADQIPQIEMRLQHQNIEYRPVILQETKREIWLPSNTELYMDFRGHRFYRQHTFTDLQFFSVNVQQTIADPKLKQSPKPHP